MTVSADAGFQYDGLSLWRPSHLRIARNRMLRYAMRRQQVRMLYPVISQRGIAHLPAHIIDLYPARHASLRIEWRGIQTLFDLIAIRRIGRDAITSGSAKAEDRARGYS